ncbi:MAG: hypothetical protein ABW213_01035 [Tardiphaga sp.]
MSNGPSGLVFGLIAGQTLAPPTVTPIEPEVRSGGFFPFCDLIKHGEGQKEIIALLDDSVLLGALVIEWGYDVPFKKHDDFKTWLIANERQLSEVAPDGVSYRGTYAVSATSEKGSGLYRTIWAFRTLAALSVFSEEMHSGSDFARLVHDLSDYRDRERGAANSQQMYQPVRCAERLG